MISDEKRIGRDLKKKRPHGAKKPSFCCPVPRPRTLVSPQFRNRPALEMIHRRRRGSHIPNRYQCSLSSSRGLKSNAPHMRPEPNRPDQWRFEFAFRYDNEGCSGRNANRPHFIYARKFPRVSTTSFSTFLRGLQINITALGKHVTSPRLFPQHEPLLDRSLSVRAEWSW